MSNSLKHLGIVRIPSGSCDNDDPEQKRRLIVVIIRGCAGIKNWKQRVVLGEVTITYVSGREDGHGIQPTVRNSRQFVWNRGGTHLGHAGWYPGCRNLFLWEALNRKLGTLNPTRRFSLTDRNMCRKHAQAGYNSACRHLARRSNGDSFGRRGPGLASCSIATPPTLGASQPLSGASFWLMWEGCDIPNPSFCSGRMGHVGPCAAQHRSESVKSVLLSVWRLRVLRVEAKWRKSTFCWRHSTHALRRGVAMGG